MLIGRIEEQKKLRKVFDSNQSEFVAVYGRRRVGKTYLIREVFSNEFTFTHTGLAKKSTREQLQNFHLSLRNHGMGKNHQPNNWLEAFDMLATLIRQSRKKRKIVFIDELPWMDAPRSSFLSAIEHFWNGFAAARNDVVLIVCGSATSWIIQKIVRNHGGLHNRLTCRIHLQPFTLNECELYAKQLRLGMNRRQLLEGYMVLGGIPYYWSLLEKEKSLALNIDDLFFSRNGDLKHEFEDLYASLFHRPEKYIAIIETLGKKRVGMSRSEIARESKIPPNGKLGTMLEDLENCGFIRKYTSIGKKTKDAIFQLIDQYTIFYFQFIRNNPVKDEHFWSKSIDKPVYNNWCGLAFERLCLLHSRQIKETLGISGIISSEYSWRIEKDGEKSGAQIDLLIDRSDGVINLCEMKFSQRPFKIDAKYEQVLQNKRNRLKESTNTSKAVHITMVTTEGLVRNTYADEIQNQVTADDLFRQ
ncbi:MAG: ATP-binding protein [Prevotella sp.]|nr:ATP-binding protein [Prevotella sp.]